MSGDGARARRLLRRPTCWIDAAGAAYALRIGPDRRSRVLLTIDEAAFRQLIDEPGLKLRPGGGWTARRTAAPAPPAPAPGRPGVVEGVRMVMTGPGRMEPRRANLARSPVDWLSARCGPAGGPWIDPAGRAAAERLVLDAEIALRGPSLTMRWDALPRSRGGRGAGGEPGDRAMGAAARVEAALKACGPARRLVEQVCIHATRLQAAGRGSGLRGKADKVLLQQGLRALAAYYRIG